MLYLNLEVITMASLAMKSEWLINLDAQELRLTLLSLGGLLRPEDVPAAKELGHRLTLQRAKLAVQLTQTNKLENLDEEIKEYEHHT